jgi:hypothetical protein
MGVAGGGNLQVDQAVAADLVEHVVKEGHACAGLAPSGAIQVQAYTHIGFPGDAMDGTAAAGTPDRHG